MVILIGLRLNDPNGQADRGARTMRLVVDEQRRRARWDAIARPAG